jgi:hypothetical protein
MTVTALAAVGAIVVGVFWTLIHPLKPGETRNGTPSGVVRPKGPVKNWAGVAGWDCAAAADRGFDAQGRNEQWRTQPSAAWRQDGCHGTIATLPMSVAKSTLLRADETVARSRVLAVLGELPLVSPLPCATPRCWPPKS